MVENNLAFVNALLNNACPVILENEDTPVYEFQIGTWIVEATSKYDEETLTSSYEIIRFYDTNVDF